MPHLQRRLDQRSQRNLVLLALALIIGTALLAFLIVAAVAKATTTSQVCSRDDRGEIYPSRSRPGTDKILVPAGAVSLVVCRYNGMNALGGAPQFGLRGVGASRDHSTIARITQELDALEPSHGAFSCAVDDDSQDVASFEYASGPSVVVTVDPGGCNPISNGHLHRLGLDKPVVSQIGDIAKPVSGLAWATVTGYVRLCGGPAPGRCGIGGYSSCSPRCSSPSSVVAINSEGLWVAMAPLHRDRFRFTIATPGTYRFELKGSGKQLNLVTARTRATVRAGQTTKVVLTIPVP